MRVPTPVIRAKIFMHTNDLALVHADEQYVRKCRTCNAEYIGLYLIGGKVVCLFVLLPRTWEMMLLLGRCSRQGDG